MFDDSPYNETQTAITHLSAIAIKRRVDLKIFSTGEIRAIQHDSRGTSTHSLSVETVAGTNTWRVISGDTYDRVELKHIGTDRNVAFAAFLETAPYGWLS